jgi:hypothetical protein
MIFRINVKPLKIKIFLWQFLQIRIITTPPHPREGALAIVTKRWDGMRWTRQRQAFLAPDEALSAYGEVVWSWRRGCWRQARGAIRE